MEFREVVLDSPREVTCLQLRCDPRKVKFSLLLATDLKKGRNHATAVEIAQQFQQTAVINSSYFGHKNEILGYAERYGQVLNSRVAQTGVFSAFFYWDGGRAGLKRRGESLPKNVPVLFQAGPRLVWDSVAVKGLDNEAKANRSGVALDSQGRVTLFALGTSSKLTLAELPELLMRPENRGGVSAVRALNFDGGKSTQFHLDTPVRKRTLPGYVEVPVFLGVSAR